MILFTHTDKGIDVYLKFKIPKEAFFNDVTF